VKLVLDQRLHRKQHIAIHIIEQIQRRQDNQRGSRLKICLGHGSSEYSTAGNLGSLSLGNSPGENFSLSSSGRCLNSMMRNILLSSVVLFFAPVMRAQRLPWVFPGDFRERIRLSDLVVSGIVE
jgi:hypothetical protein